MDSDFSELFSALSAVTSTANALSELLLALFVDAESELSFKLLSKALLSAEESLSGYESDKPLVGGVVDSVINSSSDDVFDADSALETEGASSESADPSSVGFKTISFCSPDETEPCAASRIPASGKRTRP